VEPFRQDELRELESRGWWLPHGEGAEEYWEVILQSGGWFDPIYDYHDLSAVTQHPSGRVWMFPAEARRRIQPSGGELAEGFLPSPATAPAPQAEEAPAEYPLLLVPFRVLTLASGGTAMTPWLLEHLGVLTGHAWETWAEINPETAAELGVQSGDRVRIESPTGSFEVTLRSFPGAQPGVLNVPYGLHSRVEGWGEPRGANPLAAIGRQVDPISGLPDWYSTRVRVTRL
jgi:anaerobic selenocysteine-containing dehydrogenase